MIHSENGVIHSENDVIHSENGVIHCYQGSAKSGSGVGLSHLPSRVESGSSAQFPNIIKHDSNPGSGNAKDAKGNSYFGNSFKSVKISYLKDAKGNSFKFKPV